MKLNDRQIKNAKPAEKPYKLNDGKGLYLYVNTSGGKLWRFDFSHNGKRKTLSIGKYPTVSLLEARQTSENARRLLAAGQDPGEAKQQEKRERQAAVSNTFRSIAAEWHKHCETGLTGNHAARVWDSLEKDVFPMLGGLPVSEIKVSQVKEVIEAVAARGALETAGRILQRIKAVFTYAIRTERAENNPAVPLVGLIKAPKQKHQPALPQSELTEFYRRLMLEQAERQTKIAMQLIMLTFVRNGELRAAEWVEFDLNGAEWSIPAAKMKMKAPHIVPLADWTLELLAELKEITGHSRYLFPSVKDPDKHMSENTLSYLMGRMGYKGIATPHGFRSLATDVLNENGFDSDVIERQLAHVEQNKVRAAYHRTEYIPQRKELMQWYSDFLRERYRQAEKELAGNTAKT